MRVVVVGCNGQMGRPICRLVAERAGMELVGGVGPVGRDYIGRDLGALAGLGRELGIGVVDDLAAVIAGCDVIIDVSPVGQCLATLELARTHRKALVTASTGFSAEQFAVFEAAGADIPILFRANTSRMVNVMIALVEMAARALPGTDVEIIDQHDSAKLDAPSGTALEMGRSIAALRGEDLDEVAEFGRRGAPRRSGAIGFHSLRGGDITSDHTVMFIGRGERIELTHYSSDDGCFARGAVDAAAYIAGREPRVYSIREVFGLV